MVRAQGRKWAALAAVLAAGCSGGETPVMDPDAGFVQEDVGEVTEDLGESTDAPVAEDTGAPRDVPVAPDTVVIHGELDETVPLSAVFDWARPQELPIVVIPGADHFFHRKLTVIKQLVMRELA